MDDRFDGFVKQLGQAAPRREVVQGLGALALGSLGIFGITGIASAKKCIKRCKDHCKRQHSNRKARVCRKRCQRQCA